MVAGAPIDAERWLPLRQRSYYKFTRRDKHKAKIGKGSQGQAGASKITDSLDMSKKSTATPTSPKVYIILTHVIKGGVMSKSFFRFSIHLVELTFSFPKMCPIVKSGV